MDVLITRKDDGKIAGILNALIERLSKINLLVDTLSLTKKDKEDENCNVYMGFCRLNESSFVRRIDIKTYPKSAYPFALLYFTGSAYFNRSMRLYAKKKKHMHLSDKELTDLKTGEKYECETEEEIFKVLNLKYKSPAERDI